MSMLVEIDGGNHQGFCELHPLEVMEVYFLKSSC